MQCLTLLLCIGDIDRRADAGMPMSREDKRKLRICAGCSDPLTEDNSIEMTTRRKTRHLSLCQSCFQEGTREVNKSN